MAEPDVSLGGKPSEAVPQEEEVAFIADARLISVLGEQLIGSEKVGVLELVKNAYDAGATSCVVTLEGVPDLPPAKRMLAEYADLPGPVIEIRDDGSGMNRDDLIEGWLRPATPRRARVKEQLRKEREAAKRRGSLAEYEALVQRLRAAHGGRLPIGEKGIGRLATHRLGRMLWLRTKTADDPWEWELRIDWNRFDSIGDHLVDLSDVGLTLRHQPPSTSYGPRGSGTVICCYGGRAGYSWTEASIIDAGRAVNAVASPRRFPTGFKPQFVTPHVAEWTLASPLERVQAPFELVAAVDESGMADLDLSFTPPATVATDLVGFRHEERKDLRSRESKHWKLTGGVREPACGPFLVHVRAWIRMRDWLGPDFKSVTGYLDKFGGLTVYRDGLAALPADQSAKGDWLGLAIEQIKKTANISYYHLSGEIEVSQEHSFQLRDRSSREGMIETQPYQDFVALTRAVVEELQFHMQRVRDDWTRRRNAERLPPATVRSDVNIAAQVGRALVEHYDFSKDPLGIATIAGGKAAPEYLARAAERLRSVSDQLRFLEEERDALIETAGFGLAVSVAIHELGRLAAAIGADIRRLRAASGERGTLAEVAEDLQRRADALMAEVQRLAPLRVTRGEAPRDVSIRGAIEAAKSAFSFSMEREQILCHVHGDDFTIQARFGAVAQVFANLFDNALYWIGTKGPGGAIQVVVSGNTRTVLFADSGPGISEKMKPHLFKPFYSEKSPPSGLGLYICRYYLGQSGGVIRLAREAERIKLPGSQFLLDFSATPGGGRGR